MSKKFIQEAHLKKGALHHELGIPEGHNIPNSELSAIANHAIGDTFDYEGKTIHITEHLKKQAVLAQTLKKLHK